MILSIEIKFKDSEYYFKVKLYIPQFSLTVFLKVYSAMELSTIRCLILKIKQKNKDFS